MLVYHHTKLDGSWLKIKTKKQETRRETDEGWGGVGGLRGGPRVQNKVINMLQQDQDA